MENVIPLIEEAQQGQKSSFEALIRQFSRLVFARTFLMTRDRHEAEDLTQETFFKAWDKISTLDKPKNFRAWLLTIARNVSLDHIKKRKVILEALSDESESTLPTPDHRLFQKEIQETIITNINTLDDKYRELIVLRYLEGMSYRQIQEITSMPEGTVKATLSRGLKKLREKLTPLYNDIQDKGNLHEEV